MHALKKLSGGVSDFLVVVCVKVMWKAISERLTIRVLEGSTGGTEDSES